MTVNNMEYCEGLKTLPNACFYTLSPCRSLTTLPKCQFGGYLYSYFILGQEIHFTCGVHADEVVSGMWHAHDLRCHFSCPMKANQIGLHVVFDVVSMRLLRSSPGHSCPLSFVSVARHSYHSNGLGDGQMTGISLATL